MYISIRKQIPNLFTLGNLTCGVLAILAIFSEELKSATLLVILAAVLDFFDGFLARLLKVSGELGKQLDSLADMVTFGIAPSFMLWALAGNVEGNARYWFLMLAVFSAYRLAKFNIDTRQTSSFIGVPTPVTGLMCMSWAWIDERYRAYIFENPWSFGAFCVVVSCLLVSGIHLPSLKLKKGPLSNYAQHIVLLVIGLMSLFFWGWLCVPIFYAAYVLSSIIISFAPKKSK